MIKHMHFIPALTNSAHLPSTTMAPLHTAKRPRTAAIQTISRESRKPRRQVEEEFEEESPAHDSMDVENEAEDDELGSSQGTAVQNMIIGGISNVRTITRG